MADWNPGQYLKFERDRNKPIMDLFSHVHLEAPKRIVDLGCGPGNSTRFLAARWPEAELIGLDSSKAMLETACKAMPDVQWLALDATGDLSALGRFDLVFSNAALQWMPDHARVLSNWFELLNPGGTLAIQLPCNHGNPVHRTLQRLPESEAWRGKLRPSPLRQFPAGNYYDILSGLPCEFELWTTRYYHVLQSHEDIIEWYKGTGFRPYSGQLNEIDQASFLADVLEQIRPFYPPQADGKILFDFERLFFTATKR